MIHFLCSYNPISESSKPCEFCMRVLIVGGGLTIDSLAKDVEVIDLMHGKQCNIKPTRAREFPRTLQAPFGAVFNGVPTVCGGSVQTQQTASNLCYMLDPKIGWQRGPNLNVGRKYSASTVTPNGLVSVGGITNQNSIYDFNYTDSAEILTNKGRWMSMGLFPNNSVGHCIVTVNHTTILLVGGANEYQNLRDSWFFNFDNNSWKVGPKMNHARYLFSCATMQKDGNTIVVVAGGVGHNSTLASTEVLDLSETDELEWVNGPMLPTPFTGSQMLANAHGFYLIGGSHELNGGVLQAGTKDIYVLSVHKVFPTWKKLTQKLLFGRRDHAAMWIPDYLTTCNS